MARLKGYGRFITSVSLLFFLLALSPAKAGGVSYPDELIKSASEKNLRENPFWAALLHFKSGIMGMESLVDDPEFFLAPDGKRDLKAELEATIKGFFNAASEGDAHPVCRFPARYEWLKATLNIDESRLPKVECKELDAAMAKINPKSAVLVFSDAHINSPASMFGHTLLRIDSEKESKLLSHAANYSAVVTDKNGALYVFRGLFGYYKGFFSILPYYEKVKEYSNMDHRDMWEYRLDFTEEETRRMVLHAWEMREIYTYYYFFDENCSYTLLFLLEAARPGLNLTDEFVYSAIPMDTLRAVVNSNAIESVEYRPSQATKIRHLNSLVNKEDKSLSVKLADGESNPEDVQTEDKTRAIKILSLSTEYLQYKYSKERVSREEYQKLLLAILKARGKLGKDEENIFAMKTPPNPEKGHLSRKFSLGGGVKDESAFLDINIRPAYHGLIDPDKGYVEGSQIQFMNTVLRHYPEKNRVELERLDFIGILSYAPRDEFFKPLSWKVEGGLYQETFPDSNDHLVFKISGGAGMVYRNSILGMYYGMMDGSIKASGRFEDSFSLGAGASAGIIKKLSDNYRTHLYAKGIYYELGDRHRSFSIVLNQQIDLSPNKSLSIDVSRQRTFDIYETEAKAAINIFF
ncbi:MAG: DUF4105 domain-containing protein [Thermodesulfobacteriota bacterium]